MTPQVFSRTPLPELSHCSTLWSPQYLVRLNIMWRKYFKIYAFHLFCLTALTATDILKMLNGKYLFPGKYFPLRKYFLPGDWFLIGKYFNNWKVLFTSAFVRPGSTFTWVFLFWKLFQYLEIISYLESNSLWCTHICSCLCGNRDQKLVHTGKGIHKRWDETFKKPRRC